MPTLIENLNLIESCKLDIKSAIEDKGVDMTGVSFPGYAEKIGEIETGGGLTQQDVTEKNWDWEMINNRASFVGSYIFQGDSTIRKVNLPDCKTVYTYAFYRCSNLSEISLPKCEYLYFGAFANCKSLEYVDLPECSIISESAFVYCTKISYANLPECLNVGFNAFFGCSSLTEISLPKCISIDGYAFTSTGISQLYLPECSYIYNYAFSGCSSLEVADLPKVLSLNGSTFFNCINLSSVNLPNCSYIGYQEFYNCSSLSQLTIGMNTYKVVNYGGSCLHNTLFLSGVGSIYVPTCNYDRYVVANGWSSISARIVGIGDPSDYFLSYSNGLVYGRTEYLGSSFYNDLGVPSSSVLSISLTNCISFWSSNYNPRTPFAQCSYLKSVELDVLSSVFNYMFYGMSRLEYVNIPSCEYIGIWAFANCSSLSSISIPACEYISNSAFLYCSSLSNIDLPNCSYVGSSAFVGCRSLTDVSLPVCEYIGSSAFAGTPLRKIVLPECSYISYGAFYQCYYLSYVNLSNCSYIDNSVFTQCSTLNTIVITYDSVCSIETNTFYNTKNLQYIYVTESLVSDYKVAQYWSSMYDKIYAILPDLSFRDGLVYGWASYLDSTYLDELGISANDVTSVSMSRLLSISSSTFMNHYNMVSYDMAHLENYPDDAFNGCSALSELNLTVNIGDRAFANCTGVETLSLNTSIVGDNAFENCTSLTLVNVQYDGLVSVGSDIFSNCTSLSLIKIPYGWYASYVSAEGWSQYSSLMDENQPWLSFTDGLVWGAATYLDSTFKTTLGITSNQVVSVSLPECVSVGRSCFLEFHALKDVYLPKCEYLDGGAFYGANYMNGIELPVCSYIGNYAFYWCAYSFSYIKLGYSGVCVVGGAQAFAQASPLNSIYVPASLVDAYKSAQYWSSLSARILPIPE